MAIYLNILCRGGIMSYFIRREIPELFYKAIKENPECGEVLNNLCTEIKEGAGKKCFVEWNIEDVLGVAIELDISINEEQAIDILSEMERKQDSELGITWETLECYVEEYK